jgi:flavin-dependent dehydrogenase
LGRHGDKSAAPGHAAAGQVSAELPATIDVLLAGLGPVGAVIANLLGRYGVKTLVIDQATEIFTAPRATFTRPKITPANLAALVRNLRRSPDLSVAKLRTLMKLFG